jgi:Tfp pilus assembly protein PilN
MDQDILKFFGVMMTLVMTGVIGYTGVVLVNSVHRRITRRRAADLEPGELDAIRAQLADVDELRARLSELEERLDFAERLLAQQAEAPRIAAHHERS